MTLTSWIQWPVWQIVLILLLLYTSNCRIIHCFGSNRESIHQPWSYGACQLSFLKNLYSLLCLLTPTQLILSHKPERNSKNLLVKSYYSRWIPHSLILYSIKIHTIWPSSFIYSLPFLKSLATFKKIMLDTPLTLKIFLWLITIQVNSMPAFAAADQGLIETKINCSTYIKER